MLSHMLRLGRMASVQRIECSTSADSAFNQRRVWHLVWHAQKLPGRGLVEVIAICHD